MAQLEVNGIKFSHIMLQVLVDCELKGVKVVMRERPVHRMALDYGVPGVGKGGFGAVVHSPVHGWMLLIKVRPRMTDNERIMVSLSEMLTQI